MSGRRAFSIGEPIGLAAITSAAALGSMPPRSARRRPSAKASICTARLMLIASLSTSPCPFSPMCVGVPSSRRIGSTRAYASTSPPTMIVSVPACTWGTLPETGASSIAAPSSAHSLCELAACAGADCARVDPDLLGVEAGENPVGPGGNRLQHPLVGEGRDDDLDGLRNLARRVAPLQALVDQPLRVRPSSLLTVDRVPGGEETGSHRSAHVPEADQADPRDVAAGISRPPFALPRQVRAAMTRRRIP